MKLINIVEMSHPAGDFARSYTDQEIADIINWFNDAEMLTKLEGEQLELIRKDTYYGLRRIRDQQILGWISLQQVTLHNVQYQSVDIIYILPQYRTTKAVFALCYGVKEFVGEPLLVDGAIFTGGLKLINKLATMNTFSVKTINKDTGIVSSYNNQSPDLSLAYIIENLTHGLYLANFTPGLPDLRMYYKLFEKNWNVV